MQLPFVKYHGLGNDFIVVEADRLGARGMSTGLARVLCDRHVGIGADGVLVAHGADAAAARMVIYNADGSIPEMCGNGLRCLARWLVEHDHVEGPAFVVETDAGPRRCTVHRAATTDPWTVVVEMGLLRFDRPSVHWSGTGEAVATLTVAGEEVVVIGVSVGNPHAVVVCLADTMDAAARLGARLSEHPMFQHRTNVEFVRRRPRGGMEVTVFERGCGITQACGTGAVAAVAGLGKEASSSDEWVAVYLPGGRLDVSIDWDGPPRAALRGPAERVFHGTLALRDEA